MIRDEQLIELVQEKLPEELTVDEIGMLRERLDQSAELRQVLIERLKLEEYLATALARIDAPIDAILERVEQRDRDARAGLTFSLLGGVIVLLLVGFVLFLVAGPSLFPNGDEGGNVDDEVAAANANDDEKDPADVTDGDQGDVAPDNDPDSDPGEDDPAGGDGTSQAAASENGGPVEGSSDQDNSRPNEGSSTPPSAGGQDDPPDGPPEETPVVPDSAPFSELWLADSGPQDGPLNREGLKEWFEPVPGHPNRLHETRHSDIVYGVLEGIFKLRRPWAERVVWKLTLRTSDRFRFHVYCGERGVSFRHYEQDHASWAAYATRREPGKPLPSSEILTATDDGRGNRSETYNTHTYLIWHEAGELVVSAGDVVLLRAPLPGPPTDVYVEGKASFDAMAMVPAKDLPSPPPDFPVVAEIERPADVEWLSGIPEGARMERCEDGTVKLEFEKPSGSGWIATRLPHDGLCLVDVLIEEATLGTSVFLGAAEHKGEDGKLTPEGRPESVAGVVRNDHSKLPNLYERKINDSGIGQHWHNAQQHVERRVEAPFYVRMLASPGRIRYWISSDGIHWAGAFAFHPCELSNLRYVGIGFSNGLQDAGHIKLGKIVQRELSVLSSLAPAELRRQALCLPTIDGMGDWLTAVVEAKPEAVDLSAWRRACALRTLAAGCRRQLGQQLLEGLVSDAVENLPPTESLPVLREAALLSQTWGNEEKEHLQFMLARYQRVAQMALQRHDNDQPFSLIRLPVMSAPLSTETRERVFDPTLIRDEMVRLSYRDEWKKLDRFTREIQFFSGSRDYLQQVAPLAEWARATAGGHLNRTSGQSPTTLKATWRSPVVEELSKEAYNAHAELLVALSTDAMRDACRVIGSVTPASLEGLVPSQHDVDLLISLPMAIETVMRDYPELPATMNSEFASVAQVRLQRAMTDNDPAAVELITLQFRGTPAAAAAHQWLGDRALSGGQFTDAVTHYQRAAKLAGDPVDPDLQARQRLAAAMLGIDAGEPATGPVQIGSLEIPADEFEKLVDEMQSTHESLFTPQAPGPTRTAGLGTAPEPSAYRYQEKARFDAYHGSEPHHQPTGVREREMHWVDRQLSLAMADNVLYVSTRFQVAAFDANSGQQRWISPTVPGQNANALDWPLIPMRPLVAKGRVFVRQLAKDNPALVCLDRNNGKHKWVAHLRDGEVLVSDPFSANGQLFALTLQTGSAGADLLQLVRFDTESGDALDRHPAIKLRDPWSDYRVCQVTATDGALLAVLGGAVLSMEYGGHVRWVRRQPLLPAKEDRWWIRQDHQPPLVLDGKMYVMSPGVRALDCIEIQTGHLLWRRVLPDVERIMGVALQRLIVETEDAILAIDPTSGETAWRHATESRLVAQLCGPKIVYSRRITWEPAKNLRAPELVWIDAKNGRRLARHPIAEMQHDWPRFSAMIHTGQRLWGVFGRLEERHRLLAELVPTGPAGEPIQAEVRNAWLSHIPQKIADAARTVLPQWEVLSGYDTGNAGLLSQVQNEKDVLGIGPRGDVPVVLAREVEIPKLGRPRLKVRVAGCQGRKIQVDVAFRGENLISKELPEGNNWTSFDVDLSSIAGKKGVLTVSGRRVAGDDPANIYWKNLQLAF